MAIFASAQNAAARRQGRSLFRVKELFFDQKKVKRKFNKSAIGNLRRIGAFIRTTARQSLKPAKRKTVGELNAEERKRLHAQFGQSDLRKIKKRNLPFRSARVGSPPLIPGPRGKSFLRNLLLFAIDRRKPSVVIGPRIAPSLSTTAPKALEEGGRSSGATLGPHPYMGPALQKNLPAIRGIWKDSIKR